MYKLKAKTFHTLLLGFSLVLDSVAHEESITRLVESHIPNADRTRRHGRELSYILPYNAVDKFAGLFTTIEEEIKKTENNLGITTYGVSMTSLEEVLNGHRFKIGGNWRSIQNIKFIIVDSIHIVSDSK